MRTFQFLKKETGKAVVGAEIQGEIIFMTADEFCDRFGRNVACRQDFALIPQTVSADCFEEAGDALLQSDAVGTEVEKRDVPVPPPDALLRQTECREVVVAFDERNQLMLCFFERDDWNSCADRFQKVAFFGRCWLYDDAVHLAADEICKDLPFFFKIAFRVAENDIESVAEFLFDRPDDPYQKSLSIL